MIEVIIAMTISGSMLVSAIVLFGGQQRKVQFSQSMRDIKQSLQEVLNDTATGYFPNTSYKCTSDPTNGPTLTAGAVEQGTNQSCVFLGKAVHLKANSMDVYPIVGNRCDATISCTTFDSSKPNAASQLVVNKVYQSNVDLYHIWWGNVSHDNDGHLIVFGSVQNGTGTASTGDYFNSGVQKVNAYSSSAALPIDTLSDVNSINSVLHNSALSWTTANSDVTLCFEDDSAGNRGRLVAGIVISGGSNGMSIRPLTDIDTVVCS